MKKVEFVQSAYNGGFPAPNGAGFTHGDGVHIVLKREFDAMPKTDLDVFKEMLTRRGITFEEFKDGEKEKPGVYFRAGGTTLKLSGGDKGVGGYKACSVDFLFSSEGNLSEVQPWEG